MPRSSPQSHTTDEGGLEMRETSATNIYVGNLSSATTDASLRKSFQPFGEVMSAKVMLHIHSGESRGFGFVKFAEPDAAAAAVSAMNNRSLDGKDLCVRFADARAEYNPGDKTNKMYLRNVPFDVTQDALVKVLSRFGVVTECVVQLDTAGFKAGGKGVRSQMAYVNFDTVVAAERAVDACHGAHLFETQAAPLLAKLAESDQKRQERLAAVRKKRAERGAKLAPGGVEEDEDQLGAPAPPTSPPLAGDRMPQFSPDGTTIAPALRGPYQLGTIGQPAGSASNASTRHHASSQDRRLAYVASSDSSFSPQSRTTATVHHHGPPTMLPGPIPAVYSTAAHSRGLPPPQHPLPQQAYSQPMQVPAFVNPAMFSTFPVQQPFAFAPMPGQASWPVSAPTPQIIHLHHAAPYPHMPTSHSQAYNAAPIGIVHPTYPYLAAPGSNFVQPPYGA